MGDLITCKVVFPFSENPPAEISVHGESTFEVIYPRALQLFPDSGDLDLEFLIELIDGTYQFVDLEKPISAYPLPENPSIYLVTPEYEISFKYQADDSKEQKKEPSITKENQEFKMKINAHESVETILAKIAKEHSTCTPDTFVLRDGDVTLIRPLSITEQNPGCKSLIICDSSSEAVKTPFVDLYLHGPVFLPLSDAIHLSAFLLQSEKGPSRHFNGQISSLNSFLPERFSNTPGAAADLHMEWCFLHSTSRAKATHDFVESVQRLPLFNCITFSCEWKDSTYSKTKTFELIFTKTRVIFLDNTAFKMRLSIPYDDFLSITYDDTDFTLTYTPDGETEAEIQYSADTPRALFSKAVASVISEAEGNRVSENDISTYSFRTLSEIRELASQIPSENSEGKEKNDDENPIKYYVVPRFSTVFLEDFMKMNETSSLNISTAELNHALLNHVLFIYLFYLIKLL